MLGTLEASLAGMTSADDGGVEADE
jgi:hypothetical protein